MYLFVYFFFFLFFVDIKLAFIRNTYNTTTLSWKVDSKLSKLIKNFTMCFCHEKDNQCSSNILYF